MVLFPRARALTLPGSGVICEVDGDGDEEKMEGIKREKDVVEAGRAKVWEVR
jgi:hypothetical protein